MSGGYMLDSNVLIDIAREPEGIVARHFGAKEQGEVGMSVVVSGEIRHGMQKRPGSRSNPTMSYLLSSLRIERMDPEVDDVYGRLRLDIERQGKGLSANDYWIVAHAVSKEAVLVTSDKAIHEARIAGLKFEDWRTDFATQRQD